MSFSGGGNSPLTNHVHDNNPGEGGALSQTATFRNSVIAGVQAGTIEEVT